MKLWLTQEEREQVALKRQSVLKQETINQGTDYKGYLKKEVRTKRMALDEAKLSYKQSKKKYCPLRSISI
jgi:hypothetical protein